jgi:hypothetical protein
MSASPRMLDATAYATHRVYQWQGGAPHTTSQAQRRLPSGQLPGRLHHRPGRQPARPGLRRRRPLRISARSGRSRPVNDWCACRWRQTEWHNVVSADLGELLRSFQRSAFRLEASTATRSPAKRRGWRRSIATGRFPTSRLRPTRGSSSSPTPPLPAGPSSGSASSASRPPNTSGGSWACTGC